MRRVRQAMTIWLCLACAALSATVAAADGPAFSPLFPERGDGLRLARLPAAEETLAPAASSTAIRPSEMAYVDLDAYYGDPGPPADQLIVPAAEIWEWQVLPSGLIYPSYLASTKESRLAAHLINARNDGWLMDGILGARVGIFRYGTHDPWLPQGWQLDVEGSAQLRLDIPEEVDVRSTDFRAGIPLTYGFERHRVKFAYYHLSSHLGDEFLLKNPTFDRLNFARDALVLGHQYYWGENLRSYAEVAWAFYTDISKPWEFQFGLDYVPTGPTGFHGAPFAAVNAHLRQETNYGGGFTFQAGWAWRSDHDTSLLRMGLHYFNGESNQYSFFGFSEQQIGFGLWYDF